MYSITASTFDNLKVLPVFVSNILQLLSLGIGFAGGLCFLGF